MQTLHSKSTVGKMQRIKRVKLTLNVAPTYSLLRMEEHPDVGGDTAWV